MPQEYSHRFLASEVPPRPADQCLFHVIPVPYEATVSYGGGTAAGPEAILAASDQLELFDGEGCPGEHGIFTHPVLTAIGEKYGKSPAQVALRWNVQRGVVVIPKSVKAERMAQNIDNGDFTLSEEDMAEIAKLDIGHSEIVDHNNPDFVKMLHQLKVHD